MINIYQGMDDVVNKQTNLTRHGKSQFKINTELIKADRERLNKYMERTGNKHNKINIMRILNYLDMFERSLLGNKLKLNFSYNKEELLVTTPVNLMNFEDYNVRMCDYLVAEDGEFVRVDFEDIRNILAFELGKEDLGFSFERLESELADLNVVTPHEIDRLKEVWETEIGKRVYEEVMVMAAEESCYYNKAKDEIYDYLQHKKFDGNKYYEALDYSCRRVMTVIAGSLMSTLSNGIRYKLCEVTSQGITLYSVDRESTKYIEKELKKSIIVTCVGRKFLVNGNVTVY